MRLLLFLAVLPLLLHATKLVPGSFVDTATIEQVQDKCINDPLNSSCVYPELIKCCKDKPNTSFFEYCIVKSRTEYCGSKNIVIYDPAPSKNCLKPKATNMEDMLVDADGKEDAAVNCTMTEVDSERKTSLVLPSSTLRDIRILPTAIHDVDYQNKPSTATPPITEKPTTTSETRQPSSLPTKTTAGRATTDEVPDPAEQQNEVTSDPNAAGSKKKVTRGPMVVVIVIVVVMVTVVAAVVLVLFVQKRKRDKNAKEKNKKTDDGTETGEPTTDKTTTASKKEELPASSDKPVVAKTSEGSEKPEKK